MTKLNLTCLVGSELGYVRIFNGYNSKIDKQINLKIGHISSIKKHEDKYFLSASNKLYNLDLSDESHSIYYDADIDCKIIGFDFYDESVVIGFENEIHVVNKENKDAKIFGAGNNYEAFRLLRNGYIAVGGAKTELHVFNPQSEKSEPVFKSRGIPNKRLSLPAKVHMCSIEQDFQSDSTLYCGTAFGTVELYDVRESQRTARKIANFEPNRSVTSLVSIDQHRLVAGSNGGVAGLIDFRMVHNINNKNSGKAQERIANYAKFKGFVAGSITDIEVARSVDCDGRNLDCLVSTSLDGHLAVFDLVSRDLKDKVFLGKKPRCLLIDSVNQFGRDEVWDELDDIEQKMESKKKRSRKQSHTD